MSALQRLGISSDAPDQTASPFTFNQQQTQSTFAYKWSNRSTYESDEVKAHARKWLFERYCSGDPALLDQWLAGGRKLILDAGCGSGFAALLFFGERLRDHDYLGIDISDAVHVARQRFSEASIPGDFLKANLTDLPVPEGALDIIFSEGVLHHTDNTQKAIAALVPLLKDGGRFLFYVYAKKGPVREFADDYIREWLRPLTDDEAWESLKPLTMLGKTLGELNIEIDIPEDIACLKIPKGKIDLQRLFYWHVCKMFYRKEFSLEEMNHINFDWFRPMNCHRHTPDEITTWCNDAGLQMEHLDVQEAGITVVAKK